MTDRYKLVRFYDFDNPAFEEWELFDLKTDPQEMKSVYGDPAYAKVQAELHEELKRLRAELKVPDKDPLEARIAPPQPPARQRSSPAK